MKNSFVLILFYFINLYNAEAQFMPDIPIEIEFFHPMGYKDTIIIGLSLNADDGYDEGLDVIDTSEMKFPLDVRIYDSTIQQQIGGSREYNLKHSYLSLPNLPRGSQFKFFKTFNVIVKSDNINNSYSDLFPYGVPQIDCENINQDLGSTTFRANTDFLESYKFQNSEGWELAFANVVSHSVFLNNNFDFISSGVKNNQCVSLNSDSGTQYAYLTFQVQLVNHLSFWPVSVEINSSDLKMQYINNQLNLQNCLHVNGIYIYSLNGCLLFKDRNNHKNQYRRTLPLEPTLQPIIFIFSNANEQIIATRKILH